jgi:raffinose/stachyose/melibiose transport system substrate-binding protein
VLLALAVLAVGVWSCTRAPVPAPVVEEKTIHIFQQKVEIAEALRRMAVAYQDEHPGVRIVVETVGGGQDFDAALADRFQAGTLPDVFMSLGYVSLDPWVNFAEDLTDEPWVADLRPGTADPVTRNGRIYGDPLAIEGYGFLYNKALFRKAGIDFVPDSLPLLAEACRRLQAAGVLPFSNGYAEYWVLGIHNFNVLLGSVSNLDRFVAALSSGASPGPDAAIVEGWMDLLDLTARYGAPSATLSGNYTASVAAFLAGQAALLQQGNWIEPDLVKNAPGLEVGVLPMPVRDTSDRRYPMGVPNFWVVNKNSPVKGEVKAWLEWLRSSPTGQRFLLKELKVIPPYLSLQGEALGALSSQFDAAWKQGRTLPWVFPRYLDKTKSVAAAMRSYLEHRPSHAEFWKALSRAWREP